MTDNRTFGPYLIQERIGGGAAAVVYKAQHQKTGRTVALKMLHPNWLEDSEAAQRFKKEAEIVKHLHHPCIVAVYDYGQLNGRSYLAMQYMARGSLAQRFQHPTPIGSQEVVRLLRRVGSALDHAHRHHVVHRDLKLENILLDEAGEAFLSDFGIARILDARQQMTMTGSIVGTPMYMSPEQVRGKKSLGARADLYSLAVAVYLLTIGRFPFGGTDIIAILNQHVNMMPPLPSKLAPELPKAVDDVLLRGLAKRPEDRYPSADAFIEAYARAMSDSLARQVIVDLRSSRGATNDSQSGQDVDLWQENPPQVSPQDLIQAAKLTENKDDAIQLLKQALALDPWNNEANRLLHKLEGFKPKTSAQTPPVAEPLPEIQRKVRKTEATRRHERRRWWSRLGCVSAILMSISCVLFTFSLFGILPPGFFTTVSVLLGGPTPVVEVEGVSIDKIPDAVMVVPPSKSEAATNRTMDILEPGFNHEYTFYARVGEEVAVYVQFLSLSANYVSNNVAVISPSGRNMIGWCERESILRGEDNNVAYVCRINETGDWRLRILGKAGESVGVYFAGVQNLKF